jgi:LacI family transcriptional regulator
MPEHLALIGTDNDEFLVRHSNPPITSILPGHFKMGLRAMSEMKKLLSGDRGSRKPIYIPPVSIMERTSTKPALPAAALVKRAKAYIASHGCERIEVADVVGHLGVSRRLAELRFRQMEGVSLRRAIENHRLGEAKKLLSRTDLSVTAIAERVGFSGQNRLSHVFKARFGTAPEHWRTTR